MSFDFDLHGKVALVTGASGGLGLSCARALAEQGARVVLAARRREVIETVEVQMRAAGLDVTAVPMDVTDIASIRAASEQIEDRVGPIDILINNAGVSRQMPLEQVDEAYYDWIMNTNAKGAFFMAQAAAAQMIRHRRPGRIVNIASIGGFAAMPNLAVYAMSKAAMIQLTRSLAFELAPHQINVNCICPAYIPTAISPNFPHTPVGKHTLSHLPRSRPGLPEDLHGALLLLASGQPSRLLTGVVLPVDDGYSVI